MTYQQIYDNMMAQYAKRYSPKGICSKCGKEFFFLTVELSLLCSDCSLGKLNSRQECPTRWTPDKADIKEGDEFEYKGEKYKFGKVYTGRIVKLNK